MLYNWQVLISDKWKYASFLLGICSYKNNCVHVQISPNGTSHAPNSSLENNRALNSEFYLEDELKFHGGGVGDLGFTGR